jgi:hypothetical protein
VAGSPMSTVRRRVGMVGTRTICGGMNGRDDRRVQVEACLVQEAFIDVRLTSSISASIARIGPTYGCHRHRS